jgi:2-iminobutanoate/2-iminopropanoate deaminase
MAIKRETIQPKGIHVRMMAGQPAYSQVVTIRGSGRMIFLAGQLARDPDGNCVGKGDMRAQIQQVGENIKTCLEAAGATLADIVKTNTYITDFEEFSKHGDMRMRYFGAATPTSTTVEVRPRLHDRDRGHGDRRLTRRRGGAGALRPSRPSAQAYEHQRSQANPHGSRRAPAIIDEFVPKPGLKASRERHSTVTPR